MDIQERIENFKKMANDDPGNELGHFSLGKAYFDGGFHQEAVDCFSRVIQLKPDFSKAFQHLAEAQRALGRNDEAVDTLTTGFKVAASRGDVMPRQAMATLLEELGHAPPAVEGGAAIEDAPANEHAVRCCRCGQLGPRLDSAPLKGELGTQVQANVCGNCWQEWIGMGTKVINELRLDFSSPQAAETYDAHLREFLQLPS